MRYFKHVIAGLALGAITACGNTDTGPSVGAAVLGGITSRVTQGKGAAPAPVEITRASLASVTSPVLIAQVPVRQSRGTLIQARMNQGVGTYLSADNIAVMIRDGGIVVGTRGFGDDVMAASVPGLMGALTSGGGTVTRTVQFLNGEDRIDTYTFTCKVTAAGSGDITILGRTHATRKFAEVCSGTGGQFTNTYWVGGGVIWQSHQWISRTVGRMILQKVK